MIAIPFDIFNWLASFTVIDSPNKYNIDANTVKIDSKIRDELLNGFRIAKLLTKMVANKNLLQDNNISNLKSIKNAWTPASKLYNWTILNESLLQLGYNVLTKQMQRQIVNGSWDQLVIFLQDLKKVTNLSKENVLTSINNENKSISQMKEDKLQILPSMELKKTEVTEEYIDKSENFLELIVLLLSKNLGLPPKQSLVLLTEDCKYFAHLIVKGMKGSFSELKNLMKDLCQRMNQIIKLINTDPEKNFEFFVRFIKSGILSKSEDVAQLATDVIIELLNGFQKLGKREWCFNLICTKQGGGLESFYLSAKRHPQLSSHLYTVLSILMGDKVMEVADFFLIFLKQSINNQEEYIRIILLFFPNITASHRNQVIQSGTVTGWLRMCDQDLEKREFNIEFLCQLWKRFPEVLEQHSETINNLLQGLKKRTRSNFFITKITSLTSLFGLLEHIAENKDKYASLIYKKMIFLLLQNHGDIDLRELIISNFRYIIQKFQDIPIDLLVEPFVKQLQVAQGTSYNINIFDFTFMKQLCKHAKISVGSIVLLSQFLTKLYLRNKVFSNMILRCILVITQRFSEEQRLQQSYLKSSKIALSAYVLMIETKRNKKSKQDILENNKKKALIIQLLKIYINMEIPEFNQKLKILIAQSYNQLLQMKRYNDKGLFALLSVFGIPEELAEEVKVKDENEFENENELESIQSPNKINKIVHSDTQNKVRVNKERQNSYNNKLQDINNKNINTNLKAYKEKFITQTLEEDIAYEKKGSLPRIVYFDEKKLMLQNGVGYKKSPTDINKKKNQIPIQSIKPDAKVLESIERMRIKYIETELRKEKLKKQEEKKSKAYLGAVRQEASLQHSIELGFNKIPQISNISVNKIIYEFGSIKEWNLISPFEKMNLNQQQQRDSISMNLILKKHQKLLKVLFLNYSAATAGRRQLQLPQKSLPQLSDRNLFVSYPELIKLLKESNISKLPTKILLNEIIKALNSAKKEKNVLVGVAEADFEGFFIQFLNAIETYHFQSKIWNVPLGIKFNEVIMNIKGGQRQLLALDSVEYDPKIKEIETQLKNNPNALLPKNYKKFEQQVIQLNYKFTECIRNSFTNSDYIDCYEILHEVLYDCLKINLIEPEFKVVRELNIKKIFQKKLVGGSSSEKVLARQQISKSTIVKKEVVMDEAKELAEKKRQEYMKKIKAELDELRMKKMQEENEKKKLQREEKEKVKKREQQQKKLFLEKKQQIKKIRDKEKAEKLEKIKQENQKIKAQKQKRKAEFEQFINKQNESLKKDFEAKSLNLKEKMTIEEKKKEEDKKKKEILVNNINSLIEVSKKKKQIEQGYNHIIKEFVEKLKVNLFFQSYEKHLKALFQHYSQLSLYKIEHSTKKFIEIKGFTIFLNNFRVCPKYISFKEGLKLFKEIAHRKEKENKEQNIEYQQFKQALVRICYGNLNHSNNLTVQTEKIQQKQQNEEKKPQNVQLDIKQFENFLNYLGFSEPIQSFTAKIRDIK